MKSILAIGIVCFSLAMPMQPLRAQEAEHAKQVGESPGEEEHGTTLLWMWANFILLAGVLGYMINKHGGPFYASRSRKIRKDLIEADDLRKEAEERAAAVERRLASLEAEISELRAESQREAAAETERLMAQTEAELAKLQAHTEQTIVAAGRSARLDLKRYSAGLAIDLAAQKIRGRMSAEAQDSLVGNFTRKLDGASAAQNN